MSKLNQIIELIPSFNARKEMIVSQGHECPRCHGRGECMVVDDSKDGSHWATCVFCEGTGEVDAIVTVEWRDHKSK